MNPNSPTIGDTVRVRETPETISAGVAGLTGSVHGETMPSVMEVRVIGTLSSDYALNVRFEDRDETLWFAPELLELLAAPRGAETRPAAPAAGGTERRPPEAARPTERHDEPRRRWWEFWK